jgi:hypothetical protein
VDTNAEISAQQHKVGKSLPGVAVIAKIFGTKNSVAGGIRVKIRVRP